MTCFTVRLNIDHMAREASQKLHVKAVPIQQSDLAPLCTAMSVARGKAMGRVMMAGELPLKTRISPRRGIAFMGRLSPCGGGELHWNFV